MNTSKHRTLLFTAALAIALLFGSSLSAQNFRRGDVDGSGIMNIGDPIVTLMHLFAGEATIDCPDAADTNDSGRLEMADAILSFQFLFSGGVAPVDPGPFDCGDDPTVDSLGSCFQESCETIIIPEPIPDNFAPGLLYLPLDRTVEATTAFSQAQIQRGLSQVLNSPGDSVQIELSGSVSVGLIPGVPFSVSVAHGPTVTLAEDGSYEVRIDRDQAAGLGVELVEGIEASINAASRMAVVFRFTDLNETAAALQSIVYGEIMQPYLDTVYKAFEEWSDIVDQLYMIEQVYPNSRAAAEAKRLAYVAATAVVTGIRNQITAAQNALPGAEANLTSLGNQLGNALADFGCKTLGRCGEADRLRGLRDAAQREVNRLRGLPGELQGPLATAIANEAAALADYTQANGIADEIEKMHKRAGELQDELLGTMSLDEAMRLIGDIANRLETGKRNLQAHLKEIELERAIGANVEVFLSPFPGVTLENAGIGASLSTEDHVTLSLLLDQNRTITNIEVMVGKRVTYVAQGGFGAGVMGRAHMTADITLDFALQNASYRNVTATMNLGVDAQARLVAGIGATIQKGAGREIKIALNLAQYRPVAARLWRAVASASSAGVVDALAGIEATFSVQDRWIAAAVASAGASYVGYGADLRGSATWDDRGAPVSELMPVHEGVAAIFTFDKVQETIQELAARLN